MLSKRESFTIISLWNFFKIKSLLCNSFTEGDYCKRENSSILEGELLCWHIVLPYKRKTYFQISFCYDMLCCHQCQRGRLLDTIVNCVLSLMLHKCHISHQPESTELRQSAKQFTVSTKHSWTTQRKVSSYWAHSGIKGFCSRKLMLTELPRLTKGKAISTKFIRSSKRKLAFTDLTR